MDTQVWTATETSEHEHNGSSVATTGLEPSRGVSQERWQCETQVHRVHLVSPCSVRGPFPASSSIHSPPLQRWPEVSLATQTIRSVPQFMNRAIGPVFQQWRALILVCLQISHRDGRHMRRPVELWGKQKHTAWSACQTHNRVQSVVGTWWTSRKCSSLFSCSEGWSRRAEIMLG